MFCLCVVVACVETERTVPIKYKGQQPQTPEAILEAFDPNLIKLTTNANNKRLNEKYPPIEWLQMLLDKGFVIGDSHDFQAYLSIRKSLDERTPQRGVWSLYNEEYNDWKTFKDAFIRRKVWEHKQFKAAQQKNSNVWWVDFLGADGKTVIPITNSSGYVKVRITKRKGIALTPIFFECVCSCVHRSPMLSCQSFCGEKVYISQTSPLGEQEQRLLRPHLADHTVDDTDHGVNFPRRV